MDDAVLAIDIGGTKVAAAIVASDGGIVIEDVTPTGRQADGEVLYGPIDDLLERLLHQHGDALGNPVLVGVGSAGPIDGPRGTISPVNVAGWRDYPIRDRILATVHRVLGRPVRCAVAGDGHCIAVGEHWLGAGRDVDSMVGMVVSTGVGGGAVLDNVLFAGSTGNAVHVGHTSVNFLGNRCPCGGHGCVELYARGPAMVDAANDAGWEGTDAVQLCADARRGDVRAKEAIDRGMRALAAGIAQLATDLDVTTFVIGGGVSKAGDVIFDPLQRHLADFAVLHFVEGLEIRRAELPNAGLLGAASVALSLRGAGPLRQAPPSAGVDAAGAPSDDARTG